MDKPSPPPATDLSEEFRKAHNAEKTEDLRATGESIVTKGDIEELEKQRKKSPPLPQLTPSGVKSVSHADASLNKQISSIRARLRRSADRTREDFGRSAGREM